MIFLYVLLGLILFIGLFLILKAVSVNSGRKKADSEIENFKHEKISPFGSVKSLKIMPLVDYKAVNEDFKTEPGVSYLIKTDNQNILMDLGYNVKREHPSPLLYNMEKLNISIDDIDSIFISHLHLDHLGGMAEQKNGKFSFSKGDVNIKEIPVYSPEELSPSKYNPDPVVQVNDKPFVMDEGIASIGVIPRHLFVMGVTREQGLVVNLKGKGLVIIVGCGHQRIEKIIDRVNLLFDEKIYAIVGGLHFPIQGGRAMIGPLNIQYIVGSDRAPWKGLKEDDIDVSIEAIKKADPKIVAISAHDSSDWALNRFKSELGDIFSEIEVGKEILL